MLLNQWDHGFRRCVMMLAPRANIGTGVCHGHGIYLVIHTKASWIPMRIGQGNDGSGGNGPIGVGSCRIFLDEWERQNGFCRRWLVRGPCKRRLHGWSLPRIRACSVFQARFFGYFCISAITKKCQLHILDAPLRMSPSLFEQRTFPALAFVYALQR